MKRSTQSRWVYAVLQILKYSTKPEAGKSSRCGGEESIGDATTRFSTEIFYYSVITIMFIRIKI